VYLNDFNLGLYLSKSVFYLILSKHATRCVALWDICRLKIIEDKLLRRIVMLEGGKVMAERRKFHSRIFNIGVFLKGKFLVGRSNKSRFAVGVELRK
jgi:ABC-type cobalamin transport system ATPase subunit